MHYGTLRMQRCHTYCPLVCPLVRKICVLSSWGPLEGFVCPPPQQLQFLAAGPRARFMSWKGRSSRDQTDSEHVASQVPSLPEGPRQHAPPPPLLPQGSAGASNPPAPSSGQRQREIELPVHRPFQAPRERGRCPDTEGRSQQWEL